MASILVGEESALTVEIQRAIDSLKQEVSTIKVRVASVLDTQPRSSTYVFKLCIQYWLHLCEQQEVRSAINDRIIDMDPVIEQILHSSLTIDLPPVFIIKVKNASSKKEGNITPAGQQEAETKGKKRKGGDNDDAAQKHIKNDHMITKFKMKEGEDWRQDLSGKNTKDRPKWNDKCWMCARWFTKGDCFTDCNNKESHVGAPNVPAKKKTEYLNFLNRVRGNPML